MAKSNWTNTGKDSYSFQSIAVWICAQSATRALVISGSKKAQWTLSVFQLNQVVFSVVEDMDGWLWICICNQCPYGAFIVFLLVIIIFVDIWQISSCTFLPFYMPFVISQRHSLESGLYVAPNASDFCAQMMWIL